MEKWTAAVWLASQNVTAHLATALLDTTAPDADELAILRALGGSITSPGALALRLEKGLQVLAAELLPKLQELARSEASTGAELHDKFVQQGDAFTLQFGSLNTFFGGLEAKIGPPNRNIGQAMERDHIHSEDSNDEFTTSNYMMTTTPQIEWWFVAAPDRAMEWPKEGNIKEDGTSHATRRRPLPLSELKHRLHEVNAPLAVLEEPVLMLEEGLGARLYTGPMFVKYNDLLRGFGAALAGCKSNRYVTTIHVINSVIVKASKLTKAATIYRGVAGGVLPQSFWAPNAQGVRGGIEGAFMSTTFDREVALQYASQPGKPGLVFEMHMGMIDRGCELGWISQYPHERECLFAPLTGIELLGTRIEGAVLVVEARLSINLNALTIEQVISKRRKMVGDMCIAMQAEILHEARSEPSWAQLASAAVPLLPQFTATAAAPAKVLSRQAAGADADDQAAQSASTDILAAFIRDESHATMNRFYTDEPERYNDDTYLSDTISNAIGLKRAISSYPVALQQLAILHKTQDELCLRSIDVGAHVAIENVTFNFNIGPPRRHGYALWIGVAPPLEMHEGEYVIAVEQLMGHLALGAGIRFHTSVGRVLTVKAGLLPKGLVPPSNKESCCRFDAPEGSQVVGLELSAMCPSCCLNLSSWLGWLWLVVAWASPMRLVGLKVHKAPRGWHASDASATVHALVMLLQHKELHIGQRLTLALPDPQGEIAHGISALLLLSRTLTDLSFANLGFGPEPAKAIGAALGRNTTLTRLSIRHVRLGTDGAVEIFRGLHCTGSRLRHLILNHTSIDPACGAHVRAALLAPTALTELDLADNKLGPVGCEAVAEGLARNRSLEVLRLPNNVIEEAGVKAVADALITAGAASALRVLDLSKNPMGSQGGVFMGRALAINPPLKRLRMEGVGSLPWELWTPDNKWRPPFRYEIGDEGAIALVEGLRTNTNLIFLGLRGASITLLNSAELAHAMVINPELEVDFEWDVVARFDPLMLVPGCISVFGSQKRKTWWNYRMAQKLKQRQRRQSSSTPAVLGPLRSDLQEVLLRD